MNYPPSASKSGEREQIFVLRRRRVSSSSGRRTLLPRFGGATAPTADGFGRRHSLGGTEGAENPLRREFSRRRFPRHRRHSPQRGRGRRRHSSPPVGAAPPRGRFAAAHPRRDRWSRKSSASDEFPRRQVLVIGGGPPPSVRRERHPNGGRVRRQHSLGGTEGADNLCVGRTRQRRRATLLMLSAKYLNQSVFALSANFSLVYLTPERIQCNIFLQDLGLWLQN